MLTTPIIIDAMKLSKKVLAGLSKPICTNKDMSKAENNSFMMVLFKLKPIPVTFSLSISS